jgi:hypothetical protein
VKQADQIKCIGAALARAGFRTVRAKAKALGISRSTAWTILRGTHKTSGLTAGTVRRMLSSPQLPDAARAVILDYVADKTAGAFGHRAQRRQEFAARLAEPAA